MRMVSATTKKRSKTNKAIQKRQNLGGSQTWSARKTTCPGLVFDTLNSMDGCPRLCAYDMDWKCNPVRQRGSQDFGWCLGWLGPLWCSYSDWIPVTSKQNKQHQCVFFLFLTLGCSGGVGLLLQCQQRENQRGLLDLALWIFKTTKLNELSLLLTKLGYSTIQLLTSQQTSPIPSQWQPLETWNNILPKSRRKRGKFPV